MTGGSAGFEGQAEMVTQWRPRRLQPLFGPNRLGQIVFFITFVFVHFLPFSLSLVQFVEPTPS